MNLLEVGKIVRVHGIKGAVKIVSYVDADFSQFKHVFITEKQLSAQVKEVKTLNNDAYAVRFDIIPDIDTAVQYKNESVFIDRDEYKQFRGKVYLSDLIGKPVLDENGEKLGELLDFDDYGASVVLTIKCGINSYSLPFVDEIIRYEEKLDAFVTTKQKFEDLRVWRLTY